MATENADNEDGNEFEFQGGKCGIIFLIDARKSMFIKDFIDADNEMKTKFNIAIKCCRTILMNKIIAKQKDLIGIVLFGTDKQDPKTNTKHVTLFLELNYPSAEAVKLLDNFLNDDDSVEIQRNYGSSDSFLLADALWYCSSLFSHSGCNLEAKRILLFTDDSDPHSTHPDWAHKARKRAKDLNQINISLELLPMGSSFDYSVFFKELLEIVNGSEDTETPDSSSRIEDLLDRVNRLDFKTRRYAKLKWNLGNGVTLGVSLYSLYRETTVLSKEPLFRASNEPIKTVTQTYNKATGELILPSDIIQVMSFEGQELLFSNEEMELLKKVMEPGMTLLGFKPLSAATASLHCGSSHFAYPEETLIKGSKELMKALVDRCIAKQKVALCCFTPRHRGNTKYVYLLPTHATYDDRGNQLTPCGFHIVPLPFYNDTREQVFEKSPEVDGRTVELAKKLVKQLRFAYKPSSFKNPKLQLFWAHLEALALEYDAPEVIEDDTAPNVEEQTVRLGNLAKDFNATFSLDGQSTVVTKRPASSSGTTTPAKRPRQPCDRSASDGNVIQEIKAAIQTKKVDKFTVVQLKEFLKAFNKDLPPGIRKQQLVEAVYNLNV